MSRMESRAGYQPARGVLCVIGTLGGTFADTAVSATPAALRTCCSLNNAVGCSSLTDPDSLTHPLS